MANKNGFYDKNHKEMVTFCIYMEMLPPASKQGIQTKNGIFTFII